MSNAENAVSERIKILYNHYGNGNLSAFARGLNVSAQAIRDLMKGEKGGPSWPVLQNILQAYPAISTSWLLLGHGPMLQQEGAVPSEPKFEYSGYVGQYPILSGKDNVSVPIIAGRYNRAKWDYLHRKLAPSPDEIEKGQPFESLSLPKSLLTEGRHIIFPVSDNTMEPTFTKGDWLLFRYIEKPKWGIEPERFPAPYSFLENLPVYAVESWDTNQRAIDIGRFTFDDEIGMLRCYYDNRNWHTSSVSVTTVKEVWEFQLLISPRSENVVSKQQEAINQLQRDLRQANQVITNLLGQLPAQEAPQESEDSSSLEKPWDTRQPQAPAK
jgi:hypothetical protein